VQWNIVGPPGAPGQQGPAGPAGPPGSTLVFEKRWSDSSNHPCCGSWHSAPASEVMAATTGATLLVQMDLSLVNGSHGTCRPMIDGQWAGDFGGLPKSGSDPYWTEGLMAVGCCGNGWRRWTSSRIYADVPTGNHTFTVQCATDSGVMQLSSSGSVFSSWQVFELK
jgi:hypothetical protein